MAQAKTVTSDNFVLNDPLGKMTAQLTTSGEGTPALFMYDSKGTVRVSIGLYGDGAPGIVLNDDNGLATAILRMVNNQGDPVLVLKENGQDKYILTKGGVTKTDESPASLVLILLSSLLAATVSAVVTFYLINRK